MMVFIDLTVVYDLFFKLLQFHHDFSLHESSVD